MAKYATKSDQARHYVQYDQGNLHFLFHCISNQLSTNTLKAWYFYEKKKSYDFFYRGR